MPTDAISPSAAQGRDPAGAPGPGATGTGGAAVVLTCLSCHWWTRSRCLSKVPGFPGRGANKCRYFSYEPGVDEGKV